jgi:hypothetical protein
MEGNRICFKGAYGTVRWNGIIQGKEGNWIGIEWDDQSKGKHSGEFEGVSYFKTRFPNHGSFVKESVVFSECSPAVSLEFAILNKYADRNELDLTETYAFTGQNRKKPIELVGTEKIISKQEKVDMLKEIALQGCLVGEITSGFGRRIVSCETLRLDQNLLNSWDQVSLILDEVPQLKTLSLTANRLELPLKRPTTSALQVLVLNNMGLTCQDLVNVLPQFPSLQELHLYKNFCNDLIISNELLQSLILLNLEDNQITSWQAVSELCKGLNNLEKLILNENPIGEVNYQGGFPQLTALSIENCGISNWSSIDELEKFPGKIKELRIARNPGLGAEMRLSIQRFNIIARVGSLSMLSGSAVRAQERLEAERYYLRSMMDVTGLESSSRWQELINKHGPPSEIFSRVVTEKDTLAGQTLNSNTASLIIRCLATTGMGKEVKKKLILSMTVADLKNMCAKLFGVKNNEIRLSFHDKSSFMPEVMDDNLKSIGYYVMTETGEIWVEDLG